MKKYLLMTLLAFMTATVFAQSNYQDVVFLKNGSIIRGVIIEQVPNKSIKIETSDKSVFVYQMDEIEKLTKEELRRNSILGNSSTLKSNYNFNPGYIGIVELGYQFGVGDYGMGRLKLETINGYKINPHISVGLGTGLHYFFDADALLVPIFPYIRTNLINNNTSPYFSLGVGYSFDATNSFEGVGFLLKPTIGVNFLISDKSAINVGLGYEMQKMDFYYYNGSNLYWSSENSGALSINVGFSF